MSHALSLYALLLIGALDAGADDRAAASLGWEIEVIPEFRVVSFTEDIPVRVQFRNAGSEPWMIETPERSSWVALHCETRSYPLFPFFERPPEDPDDPDDPGHTFNTSWNFGASRRITARTPTGRLVTSTVVERPVEIEIKSGAKHEFKHNLYRRSRRVRESAPGAADSFIRTFWRPGQWKVWVTYTEYKPDLRRRTRFQSAVVEFTILMTEDSVRRLSELVTNPEEGRDTRKWAGDFLRLIQADAVFEWPWHDAKQDERDAAEKINQRVIAEFDTYWRGIKDTPAAAAALRKVNAAFGVGDDVLDEYFGPGEQGSRTPGACGR